MRDATYVYQNELDKVYLQRDMAESIMCKSSDIAKSLKYDRYQHRLAPMIYKCF